MLPNMENRHRTLVTFNDAENGKEVLEERIDLFEQVAIFVLISDVDKVPLNFASQWGYSRSDPKATKRSLFCAHNNFLTTTPIN